MESGLQFQVFKNGQIAEDFSLSAAYIFGADTIPLPVIDEISFRKGIIDCRKRSAESAGLALLWQIDGFGKVILQTTRLPERKKPYNLNLELARARLMQITIKREEWSFIEEADAFVELAHEAQALFIEALQNISDPARASVLADESLKKSVIFSEKLAARNAEVFLSARRKSHGLGRHSMGCCVDPAMLDNPDYYKWLLEMFGYVTIPTSWACIEPEKGRYNFSVLDRCIEKLSGKRLAFCVGPVLSFTRESLPVWLADEKWEFEKIRETAYDFVSRLVGRYAGHIHIWRVINGMNAYNHFHFNFEQIIEMTRTACLAARSADCKSRKIVEIALPWGEYYAYNRETIPPFVYADMIIQSAVSFDAFGLALHFGKDQPGMHLRDMMQISSLLDFFAVVSKPLNVTGFAVPDSCGTGDHDCERAGIWRRKWDESTQAAWIEQVFRIILSRPHIQSVTYSSLMDSDSLPILASGLLNSRLEPKKAFMALAKLQKLIVGK